VVGKSEDGKISYTGALAVTNACYRARETILAARETRIMEPRRRSSSPRACCDASVGAITIKRAAAHHRRALLGSPCGQRGPQAVITDVTGLSAAMRPRQITCSRAAQAAARSSRRRR
jgi:hypothetical protein